MREQVKSCACETPDEGRIHYNFCARLRYDGYIQRFQGDIHILFIFYIIYITFSFTFLRGHLRKNETSYSIVEIE